MAPFPLIKDCSLILKNNTMKKIILFLAFCLAFSILSFSQYRPSSGGSSGSSIIITDIADTYLITGTSVDGVLQAHSQLTFADSILTLTESKIYTPNSTRNTVVGDSASPFSTSSHDCSIFGYKAGYSHIGADYSCAFGAYALYTIPNSYRNNAFGFKSLYVLTDGICNSAFGYQSFLRFTEGSQNSGFGSYVFYNFTGGDENSGFGDMALQELRVGNYNTGLGASSLANLRYGHNTIGIGYEAGKKTAAWASADTINQSIFIGAYCKPLVNNSTNEIIIGFNAEGFGSHTATIGNASLTDVYCAGDGEAIIHTGKIQLKTLNTAPSSASATGTLGEVRYTATYIYVCTATNTWVRSSLATW